MINILTRIFGSRNERLLKQYGAAVRQINALEPAISALSDDELAAKTVEFKGRVTQGETLDALLPEAFAVVREAGKRALQMRHFDVQLIGGMALHNGKIAEMRTGEGKTLVATLPIYLNAVSGNGVHLVTVNDYLAQRDADWMGRIYRMLGLTVGVNLSQMNHADKQAAYAADVTYGTNNEFGFDYLRDNMVFQASERVQRGLSYAIVDEVDSILIDEARTPLIISGQADDNVDMYHRLNDLAPKLQRQVDEKAHQVLLSEQGHEHAEQVLSGAGLLAAGSSLYDAHNIALMHHLYAALRAHALFHRDQHYVVQNGEVVIVDEFTGRLMAGRRWSDGLHQAVEAKEGVKIQNENQTLASITFQNYFRMYAKLSGMTGTADTEAYEFQSIYGLEVVVIPTHRPMVRKDHSDLVYLTRQAKFDAVIEDIKDCYSRGQPVLVGTTSIETSELVANQLALSKIPHEVLNAKQHEREAQIVAQAGRAKAVTIATNMAGRGTDIVLGGSLEAELHTLGEDASELDKARAKSEWQKHHDEVLALGGLHIIGTERHESRRIDNQLRGRSGRQGDAGSSRFYLSLEDNLMRIFAAEWVQNAMRRMGMKENEVIESAMVTKQIQNAQRKVEAHNFDIRKNLLDFDDVANDQRKVIYQQRNELLESESVQEAIEAIREDVFAGQVRRFVPENSIDEQWDIDGLERSLAEDFGVEANLKAALTGHEEMDDTGVVQLAVDAANRHFAAKEAQITPDIMRHLEKHIMLNVLDQSWKEHLARMDYLRQGIHLRGYAQKQPKQEYKRESFELFSEMLDKVKREVITLLARVRIRSEEEVAELEAAERQRLAAQAGAMQFQHPETGGYGSDEEAAQAQAMAQQGEGVLAPSVNNTRIGPKIGRNDPCPCGSGKKYKQCHGQLV